MKLSEDAKTNIKAAFESNKNAPMFFADENGHCFENAMDSPKQTILVNRADYEGKESSGTAIEKMTVKQLTEELAKYPEVTIPEKATKADLLALLTEAQEAE